MRFGGLENRGPVAKSDTFTSDECTDLCRAESQCLGVMYREENMTCALIQNSMKDEYIDATGNTVHFGRSSVNTNYPPGKLFLTLLN